jgi:RNA polymerase sigma factor for flagellar operon FliA
LVVFVAGRLGGSLPASIEHADLVSFGTLGLIEAIERFDYRRGVKFDSFAVPRIRGAMLDGLRALDWAPKSVRATARALESAEAKLTSELRRPPTTEELASELQLSEEDTRRRMDAAAARTVVALEEPVPVQAEDGESVSLIETLADADTAGPGTTLEDNETKVQLLHAVRDLPPRERLLVTKYYFDGLTMAHVGELLGVTVSRVSQIHKQALLMLRTRMNEEIEGNTAA